MPAGKVVGEEWRMNKGGKRSIVNVFSSEQYMDFITVFSFNLYPNLDILVAVLLCFFFFFSS